MSDGDALQAAECDLEVLARRGANLFVEMIFRDGFYHADPHPGNLMVLVDPRTVGKPRTSGDGSAGDSEQTETVIGVLDSGMVARLDEPLRDDIETAHAQIEKLKAALSN